MSRWFLTTCCGLVLSLPARADNPPPSQLFYVPFPEDQQLTGFLSVTTGNGGTQAADPLAVFVTFSAATDGTVIYYDHWEDGYEKDITDPTQSSTQIFGDGNLANGYPPGNAGDLIPAGTVFNLRNFVTTSTLQAVLDYDARDKIGSFKPISVTKTSFPDGTDTLMAGCLEVFENGLWGTEYRSPVGVNMPETAAAGNLTFDENVFSYVALSVMAGPGGASVQIDKDNNGSFEETLSLAEGESVYRADVNVGGRVLATKPVQVVLFSGTIGSNYASRDTNLLPVNRWSPDYFAPVSTPVGNGTVTFLYNPGGSDITVNYDYRSSDSAYTTATVTVPAGGNARVSMLPASGGTHLGAYRFYTSGAIPPTFYAISAIDADAASGSNQAWDGGFTLVGRPSLTTQVLLSLGIGRDPYSATNPTENGNPVWFTTVGNGHVLETVYVDYNGDNAGPLTDPNGNSYDVAYSLRELQQQKVFDPDGDQTGMLVYTLNPSVRIAAAWGQDPTTASAGAPGLDVASLIPPLREGEASKKSTIAVDTDGDGHKSAGDTLEYDIRTVNSARANIPGPFKVIDSLPADTTYVPASTRYRYSVGGIWQAWISVADDASGTPYPLDGSGLSMPGNLLVGQQLQVVFKVVVDSYVNLFSPNIVNSGLVEISPFGLILPIQWADELAGSIGDRVWNDLDGDGVQDGSEAGISAIDVFADLNNNGTWDTGEPKGTTDSNGNYLIAGLSAGTYTVRVDPADVAAANVGYGPSYDLDGIATSYVATVVLAAAQDRVDADFGFRVGASVGDRVWMDRDADDTQEAGEPGINGVRVYIDLDNDNAYDVGEPNTITSGDGTYYIGNLNPGTYAVRVDTSTLPGGATQTYDLNGVQNDHEASVTLLAAEHRGTVDFGYNGSLSIGDYVWEDVNGDGVSITSITYNVYNGKIDINNSGNSNGDDDGFIGGVEIIDGEVDINGDGSTNNSDDGFFLGYTIVNGGVDINGSNSISNSDDGSVTYNPEPGIVGVRVFIDMDGDGVFDANEPFGITDTNGLYSIGNLFNSSYTVRVDTTTLPASFAQTYDLSSPTNDHTAFVTLSGSSRTDVDFGYRNDATIGDLVWNDRNGDGIRDAGEPGIEGVMVYIDADGDNLFDQGGERFAITDVTGFYQFENLAAGTYSVRLEISTLPQGSTQTYDLDGTGSAHEASRTLAASENAVDVDFGYRASASFGDLIWNDIDADGIKDAGESGITNVRVYVDINGDGVFNSASEPSDLTDSSGIYLIDNLVPGTYTARVDTSTLPAGMSQTFDAVGALDHAATFFISATQVRTDIDFAYTAPVTIGDLVWADNNANGQFDGGETGIAGVSVTVYNAANDTVAGTTTTGPGGLYSFPNLLPGTYYIVFDSIAGRNRTLANQGSDSSDSDADINTGRTANVTLTGGQSNLTLDAGYFAPATIGDFVFNDANANGQQDGGETGLAGVTVTLTRPGFGPDGISGNADDATAVATQTTVSGGAYSFSGLRPGTYQVNFGTLAGFSRTLADQGADATDSDANPSTGQTANVFLAAGATNNTIDAGYFAPATIGDFVFNDANANGQQDGGETGLAGVTVTLYRPNFGPDGITGNADDATAVATQTTVSGGAYIFSGLRPGTYQVNFGTLAGYSRTLADQGADATDSDPNPSTGQTANVVLAAGATNNTIDSGYFAPATIGDLVFNDANANGQQDGGETGLAGVTVTLYRPNFGPDGITGNADDATAVATLTTVSGGAYSFSGLRPGIYQVNFGTLAGYSRTIADQGADATDSDANVSTGQTANVVVAAGATNNTIDSGYFAPATIGDLVFNDANANGQQDGGETGLAGVTVTLYRPNFGPDGITGNADDATAVAAQSTVSGGAYSFSGLRPGTYQVNFGMLAGYSRTLADQGADATDSDANVSTGQTGNIVLAAGATNNTIDAGFYQPAIISGHLYIDTNGNGTQNPGEPNLANVNVVVTDSNGNPQTVSTDSNGNWTATLPPGSTSANVDETDPQYPTGYIQTQGTDPTTVTAVAGANTGAGIDGYAPPVDLGIVKSVDNSTPLVGSQAVFTLVATNNGIGAATGVTVSDTLPSGYTFVSANPPAAYNNGTGVWTIGAMANGATSTLTITGRVNSSGSYLNVATISGDQPDPVPANDTEDALTTPIQLGAITGTVWEDTNNDGLGDTAIQNVILSLVNGSGSPVLDGNGQPRTATSAADGTYSFGSLPPGNYGVVEMQPVGYASLSDKDMGNLDEIRPIAVLAGQANTLNDFVEISRCPDTWADWKQLHPTETAAGNPDADAYDNFAEFAFAMPHDDGTGSPWLGNTAWIIRPSTIAVGTLEGVFVRPKGAPQNVSYTLQSAAVLGNPTVWQSLIITPLMITTVDNGDCTETVTIHGLEALTGLTGGAGSVRIKAELDEVPSSGTDHTSYAETEGWKETPLDLCCRTYSNPFLRESLFTGTITGVTGQTIDLSGSSGSQDLAFLLAGGSYYVEVTSGENEGHRFDVVSATADSLELASDANLFEGTPPFNTLVGTLPVNLAGDRIILRRHWTLGEIFPADGFGGTDDRTTADQIQLFANGAWTFYWLYDDGVSAPIWVKTGDNTFADQGATVIPPGQGLFFNNRTSPTSILAYGEVRPNDFIRPLLAGSNLVAGGYPLDQSPTGIGSRQMTSLQGFFGSRDIATADTFYVWRGDATAGINGYDSYFLNNNAPRLPSVIKWVKIGDATLIPYDAEILLLGNRSVFLRAKNGLPAYTTPSPWSP